MKKLCFQICFVLITALSFAQGEKEVNNTELYNEVKAIADSLVLAKDWKGVVEYHTKALQYKPNDPVSLLVRGNAYLGLGEDMKAYNDFDLLIQLNDQNRTAYFSRAMAALNLESEGVYDERFTKSSVCDDLMKARNLGLPIQGPAFNIFYSFCPDL